MAERYGHTQVGWMLLVALGAGIVLIAVLTVADFNWIGLGVLAVLAACLALFPTLTVRVDDEAVRVHFGAGLIRRTFPLAAIESCRVVRTPWYFGWGIRWMPRGWMWRVSGLTTVELERRTARTFRIGTDEPDDLAAAIERALSGQSPMPGAP